MSVSWGAWWGGVPLVVDQRHAPRYVRARGLDASVSTVCVPASYFRVSPAPEPIREPFRLLDDTSPPLLGRMHESEAITFSPVDRPPFVADLVFAQGAPGAERILRAKQLYYVSSRVVDPQLDPPVLQIQLADIRRFWDEHGEITASWNVLRGRPEILAAAEPEVRRYVARSAKDGGTVAKPLREIAQACLRALPGALTIDQWPDDYLADKPPPEEIRAWGASPKEVLRGLMDYYRLEFDLGANLKAAFWGAGEGPVGELQDSSDAVSEHDPLTGEGVWKGEIVADGNRYTRRPTHRPDEVLVVGGRTVFDVSVDFLTPVLVVTEETPVGPQNRVIEVTPGTLRGLARGVPRFVDSPDEPQNVRLTREQKRALNLVLGALAPSNLDDAPTQLSPSESEFGVVDADPYFWQRLPFTSEDGFQEQTPWLGEATRKVLHEQLWRYYQVPASLRRLLPLLKRAEVDHKGERLDPRCEAFGFRAVSARVRNPAHEALRARLAAQAAAKLKEQAHDRALLSEIQGEIAAHEAKRKRLLLVTAPGTEELFEALRRARHREENKRAGSVLGSIATTGLGVIPGGAVATFLIEKTGAAEALGSLYAGAYALFSPINPLAADPVSNDDAAIRRAWAAGQRWGLKWARTLADLDSGGPAGVGTAGGVALARLLGLPPEALDGPVDDSDQIEVHTRRIEERLEGLRREERALVAKLNPRQALEKELGDVEKAIRAAASKGAIPADLRARADTLRDEIEELEQKQAREEPRPDNEPEFIAQVYHQNLARHDVPFRVVDEELGIVAVDALPGWLADATVADPRGTYFVPMPVRLTFGSWNRHDVDIRSGMTAGGEVTNPYLRSTLAVLQGDPDRGLAGLLAHELPIEEGERQIRLAFARGGPETGNAIVGPHARLVTIDGRPPFQELVRLGGISNRGQLVERVLPLVRSLLDQEAEVDDGSITLEGPRNVVLSGRVSAVDVSLGQAGWVTEVSFGVDAAPLPGVEGRVREPGPINLTFGLDVESER